MKRITLPKILHALETMTTEVTVDTAIAARARASVEAMLAVPVRAKAPVKAAA
jgi:quinolinate synthase